MPIVVSPTTDATLGAAVAESTEGHVEIGLGRLIERWKGKPNVEAFLRSYLEEFQELEEAIWFVLFGRMLDYAEGDQLDQLGKIVGQSRDGTSDAVFHARISVRVRINRSFGTPTDVLEMLALLTAAQPHLREIGTAAFIVWLDTPPETAGIGYALPGLVAETRAAGVSGFVSFPVDRSTSRGAFFGSSYDPTLNAARGFSSSYDSSIGGLWSHGARA